MEKVRLFDRSHDYESFEPGERIFEAGDEGSEMYVVLEGTVAIGSDDVVVDTVTAGGIFGEMALIDDAPRSASAWAETPVRVIAVDRERFHRLVAQTPQFALQVMSLMADRLRRLMPTTS